MSEARLALVGVSLEAGPGPGHRLTLDTTAGPLPARYHPVAAPRAGLLWLGHAGPDDDFEPLARRFQALGAASLAPGYRRCEDPAARGLDALVGAHLLRLEGAERLVLIGRGDGARDAAAVAAAVAGLAALALWDAAAGLDVPAGVPTRRFMTDGEPLAVQEDLGAWLAASVGLPTGFRPGAGPA